MASPSIRAMVDGDTYATLYASTAAGLQAAIDSIAGTKGKVYIGPGTLSTGATTINVSKNAQIQGSGYGVTTILGNSGTNLFNVTSNCEFSEFTVDTCSSAFEFSAVASVLDKVLIEEVEVKNFNRGVYGNSATPAVGVRNFVVRNCVFTTGTSYGIFISLAIMERVHIEKNVIKDCVQRAIDLGGNSLVFADDRGMYVVEGNLIDGVTAVGASAIALICYGWRAMIINNVVKNVSRDVPTASDCDGIYTKCRYSVIADNVLVDAGQAEAFINVKGGARNETVVQPYGFSVIVANNMLVDTQVAPTLAGGAKKSSGIKIATSDVLVIGNMLNGLTDVGIYSDSDSGSDAPCHNLAILDNQIKDHRGKTGIAMYGRGSRIRVVNNLIDTIYGSFDTSAQNVGIDVAKKEGSGLDIVGNRVYNIVDNGTTPVCVSLNPGALSQTTTVVAATDTFTTPVAHTYAVNDTVKFATTVTLPAPLVVGTTYYIKTIPTGTTYTLSATAGGATIDITDTGTGVHTVYKLATLTGWRIADNHLEGARYGAQFTWDQTYIGVDDVLVRHNTGRNINATTPPVLADLIKYSDIPTNLVDLPARVETIARVSATVAELKNGTSNQDLKIYGSDDGAGNYERFSVRMDASHATLDTEAGGTGSVEDIEIRFAGVAKWKFTTSGHVQPSTTNVSDIGSAALRTRDVYIGGDLLANNVSSRLYLDYTNSGTIGNVTINKASGRCNVAAGSATVTVTNNRVTAASHVLAVAAQNDVTGYVKNVVTAAGSFVVNLGANATANMAVDFVVHNAD